MTAGNHQRVKSPGGAVIFGPHAIEFCGGADEDRLHHAVRVRVVRIQAIEARQRAGANSEYGRRDSVPATPGQYPYVRGIARCVPVNMLTRQVMHLIEGSRVVVVVRPPYLALELDLGAIRKVGEVTARGKGHLSPRVWRQFHGEALAVRGDKRRIDNAAFEDRADVIRNVQAGWRGRWPRCDKRKAPKAESREGGGQHEAAGCRDTPRRQ